MIKVGDIFELPENVVRIVGRRGRLRNSDESKIVGVYEVIKVETEKKLDAPNDKGERIEKVSELKGKIIVVYTDKWQKKHIKRVIDK